MSKLILQRVLHQAQQWPPEADDDHA